MSPSGLSYQQFLVASVKHPMNHLTISLLDRLFSLEMTDRA